MGHAGMDGHAGMGGMLGHAGTLTDGHTTERWEMSDCGRRTPRMMATTPRMMATTPRAMATLILPSW